MPLQHCLQTHDCLFMEGALGERLKREYGLVPDGSIALAGLLYTEAGRSALSGLWRQYAAIARRYGLPFLAATPTRRANRERLAAAGLDAAVLRDNARFLLDIKREAGIEMYAGGLMGCRGDAYTGKDALPEKKARAFHAWQADHLARAGVDFLYAGIMPALPEALGMAAAMAGTGLPYIISFTIGRDGKLIDGTTIHDAIRAVDAAVSPRPLCYMTNCVHPFIARQALGQPCNQSGLVRERFKGIQANTSPLPYAELDGAADLRCAAPEEFAKDMLRLYSETGLKILGGCCGTDNRHMEAVARRVAAASPAPSAELPNHTAMGSATADTANPKPICTT